MSFNKFAVVFFASVGFLLIFVPVSLQTAVIIHKFLVSQGIAPTPYNKKCYQLLLDPEVNTIYLTPEQLEELYRLADSLEPNAAQLKYLHEVLDGKHGPRPDFASFGEKYSFWCDAPLKWQMHLHDPASISMEGIPTFNKHLLFTMVAVVVFVGWLLYYTLVHFEEYNNSYNSKFDHSQELGIVWAPVASVLILLVLAGPFFHTAVFSGRDIGSYSFFEGFRPPVVLGLCDF